MEPPPEPSLTSRDADLNGAVSAAPVRRAAAGLALPPLTTDVPVARGLVCAISSIAANGRVADRSCLRALAWEPTTRLRITAVAETVSIVQDAAGSRRIGPDGHLRLLSITRRLARVSTGDRLLLVADPAGRALTLYSMTFLAAVLSGHGRPAPGEAPL